MKNKSKQLIDSLCNSSIYDHEVIDISVIETHISWVLLTGIYAYKIKKPIKFSFVDFSTLEKRHFFCNEELRLNSRLAPHLYLNVIAITGSPEHPSFKKSSKAIEYAVKMRQFSQESLLSNLSTQKQLAQGHIDDIANQVAEFHMRIDKVSTKDDLGTPEDINYWVTDNIEQIETILKDMKNAKLLNSIKTWSNQEYYNKAKQVQQRKDHGFVRECHGDMHLGNMVLIENSVTIFDGIDFNEHLRWIDVMSEVAFVVMDLTDRGYPEFANRFINLYLQLTGDYAGLCLFNYYLVYRAMVRAKVALLRISQKHLSENQEKKIKKEFGTYLKLASCYIAEKKVALIITNGLSGSGKSTYTESLLELIGAIRIRSDVERKRLHGYAATAHTQSGVNEGIYTQRSSRETYSRLANLSKTVLTSGYSVIVDACFLERELRDEFHRLASSLEIPFIILEFQATENCLKQRLIKRAKDKSEPSEADLKVLSYQLNKNVPLGKDEKKNTININTEEQVHLNEIVKAISSRM